MPISPKKRKLWVILGIFLSLFFLWRSFRNTKFSLILEYLKSTKPQFIALGISSFLTGHLIRAIRWKWILRPTKRVKYLNSLGSIFIGILGNTIFPLRAGELWRSFAIKFREGIPFETALSSLAFERTLDGIAVIALVLMASLKAPQHIPLISKGLRILTLLIIGAAVFFLLLAIIRSKAAKGKKGKFFKFINNVVQGFRLLGNPVKSLLVVAISLAIWSAEVMSYYLILTAFGINPKIYLPFFVMLGVNVGVSIPSGPGFIGTFEYAILTVLTAFGIEKGLALSFAITYHSVIYISASLLGLIFAYIFGISFKSSSQSET